MTVSTSIYGGRLSHTFLIDIEPTLDDSPHMFIAGNLPILCGLLLAQLHQHLSQT